MKTTALPVVDLARNSSSPVAGSDATLTVAVAIVSEVLVMQVSVVVIAMLVVLFQSRPQRFPSTFIPEMWRIAESILENLLRIKL